MNEKFDKKLVSDFPELFSQRFGHMSETAMCWGFECGDGWFDIIYDCAEKLSALENIPVASQVKEKYGTLRFYINSGTDEAYKIIEEAEKKSSEVCEFCGKEGKLRGGSWLYTACDEHSKE